MLFLPAKSFKTIILVLDDIETLTLADDANTSLFFFSFTFIPENYYTPIMKWTVRAARAGNANKLHRKSKLRRLYLLFFNI